MKKRVSFNIIFTLVSLVIISLLIFWNYKITLENQKLFDSSNASILKRESELEKCINEKEEVSNSLQSEKSNFSDYKEGYDGISTFIISWNEAISFQNEYKIVCGPVVNQNNLTEGTIFLDLGAPYPSPNRFSVVIWPEEIKVNGQAITINPFLGHNYNNKEICVIGLIDFYKNVPQIQVRSYDQIQRKVEGIILEKIQ